MALEKALITNTVSGESVAVLFNPEEYTLAKDINFAQAAIPGLSAPVLQFVNGNLQTLDMELFLDTYEEHRAGSRRLNEKFQDVRELARRVTDLMNIMPETHAPPVLLFTWASLSFTCVLSKVSQKFVMFLPEGTPVRARLTVSFSEYRNVDLEAKEVRRETADYSKRYVVGEGETLSGIAGRVYGDARLWRPLALANRIDNARALPAGLALRVPQLPYRDPDSGRIHAAQVRR
ncbi:MAG: LysM peptidoglycan-binding domain-containing protein [Rhodanobacteraceae bacterium]|nr:LysM peptidoglycan-binding domain-containing protein [Rhodanobacteraceae bacterium]